MKRSVAICTLFLITYLIGEVHNEFNKQFRCKSGKYIRNEWFCDGDKDCESREDENIAGCKRYGCGRSKFSCDNSTSCKNITVRCNTIKDCQDGTDELNCGDEVNVKNCTGKDKFLCHDGLRCLDLQYTCDSNCNCFDCSDENDNCTKTDNDLLRRCPNAYFVTANGPECLCDEDDDPDPICKSIQSCTGRTYSCEQRCIKFREATQCSCFPGYHPINGSNGASCQSDAWYGNAILYATVLKIKSLNVSSNVATVVQSGVYNCTALTAANNYVYYATLAPGNKAAIFKSALSSGTPTKIVETDFPVTSVAVDYVTNNIYFTSNGSLSVCTNNGSICIKLKCCDINYVTLAPKSGLMFYTQSHSLYSTDSALLMKSNMDGSNETIFADDVYRGNISIVADESESKLYLLEISNENYNRAKIDQVTFDAGTKDTSNARYVRCLGVLDGDIFITLDQKNDIYHTKNFKRVRNINEDSDAYFRDNSTSSTKQLYAYNSLLQRTNQNPCGRSRCYGICLIKPFQHSSYTLTSTCVCDNTKPSSTNLRCSNYPVQSASSSSSAGTVVFILVLVILAVLGVAGYFFVPQQTWYQYYSTIQTWQRSKRSQRLYTNNSL